MSDQPNDVKGTGTVLRGNYSVQAANDPKLAAASNDKSDQTRRTEEFEKAARQRIGGSIAFVTKLKDNKDPLFWDGEES